MKRKLSYKLFACIFLSPLLSTAQKTVKDYDFSTHSVSAYQVDNATGRKNGFYKSYYSDGSLYEQGSYKMNRKNGVWKTYDSYGKVLSLKTYFNDKENGIYKESCEAAAIDRAFYLCTVRMYKMGIIESKINYFENGKKQEHLVNGRDTIWFENGHVGKITNEKGVITLALNEDGKPQIEIINGKTCTYKYDVYSKLIRKDYDSLNFHVEYDYLYKDTASYIYAIYVLDKKGKLPMTFKKFYPDNHLKVEAMFYSNGVDFSDKSDDERIENSNQIENSNRMVHFNSYYEDGFPIEEGIRINSLNGEGELDSFKTKQYFDGGKLHKEFYQYGGTDGNNVSYYGHYIEYSETGGIIEEKNY